MSGSESESESECADGLVVLLVVCDVVFLSVPASDEIFPRVF